MEQFTDIFEKLESLPAETTHKRMPAISEVWDKMGSETLMYVSYPVGYLIRSRSGHTKIGPGTEERNLLFSYATVASNWILGKIKLE